ENKGKPNPTAYVRRNGGWFGGAGKAPDLPIDADGLTEADLDAYVAALDANGFFGPASRYMNPARNRQFAGQGRDRAKLRPPDAYADTGETRPSRLAEPMRADCSDLTEVVVPSGHWMAQEKPAAVNAALARWIATRLPQVWPT